MFIIEEMSLKGDGISAKIDDREQSCYFPGTCPGEIVQPHTPLTGKNRRCTDFIIEKKSTDRIKMPCPHAEYCSGCTYQHIAYSAQLTIKKRQLESIFSEFQDSIPIVSSKEPYRYRNRVTLLFSDGRAGFYTKDRNELFSFSSCLLLKEEIESAAVRAAHLQLPEGYYGVTVYKDLEGEIQMHFLQNQWDSAEFIQVNESINMEIVQYVRSCLGSLNKEIHLLDLYCGNGNFSFETADIISSTYGIDISYLSVHKARSRASDLGLSHFTFETASVEDAEKRIQTASEHANTLIIDPPRRGLKNEAAFIAALDIPDVIYISCNPVTCRKDIDKFIAEGYDVVEIKGFDMFPQTPHIETVLFLRKHGR